MSRALVDYSSESEEDEGAPAKLPPPRAPLDAAPVKPAPEADVQGRVRRFPHVEGNWAITVYIPVPVGVPSGDASSSVARYLAALQKRCPGEWVPIPLHGEAGVHDTMPLHVSLSRTFPLREHQVDPFIALLRKELAACRSFPAVLENARFLDAEDASRRFAVLLARQAGRLPSGTADGFLALIAAVDAAVVGFGKPAFYQPPIPHASIGWMPLPLREEEADEDGGATAPPAKRARLQATGGGCGSASLQPLSAESVCDACDVLASEQEGGGEGTYLDPPAPVSFNVTSVHVKCSTARSVEIALASSST